jgi:hypothetical protein
MQQQWLVIEATSIPSRVGELQRHPISPQLTRVQRRRPCPNAQEVTRLLHHHRVAACALEACTLGFNNAICKRMGNMLLSWPSKTKEPNHNISA